jgi:hypothetical protein
VTGRRFSEQISTSWGFRLFWAAMAAIFAYLVVSALSAETVSAVSITIRIGVLALCMIMLSASFKRRKRKE